VSAVTGIRVHPEHFNYFACLDVDAVPDRAGCVHSDSGGAGELCAHVFGWPYLEPFYGWARFDGPPLKGAQITLTSGQATFRTTTLADGTFSLDDAPAGTYTIRAELPPLVRVIPATRFFVPEVGRGSSDVALRTTSELRVLCLTVTNGQLRMLPFTRKSSARRATTAESPDSTLRGTVALFSATRLLGRPALFCGL